MIGNTMMIRENKIIEGEIEDQMIEEEMIGDKMIEDLMIEGRMIGDMMTEEDKTIIEENLMIESIQKKGKNQIMKAEEMEKNQIFQIEDHLLQNNPDFQILVRFYINYYRANIEG